MSSIISDLFYGSKQNIIDNYLINRNHQNQPSSLQQKQQSQLCTSFIQFIIKIPNTNFKATMLLRVQVQMGNRSDEGFVEIKPAGDQPSPTIILAINDLQKQDLSKYTNIKIVICQGKYSKVQGYIPIETVRTIANSFSSEKTVIVQMKGKQALPFSTVQCIVRVDFPSNNILNSEIMQSLERNHESYLRSKQYISGQSNQTVSKNNQSDDKSNYKSMKRRKSSNMIDNHSRIPRKQNVIIQDINEPQFYEVINKRQGVTEYVKQIEDITIFFSKLQLLKKDKFRAQDLRLKIEEQLYQIDQQIKIKQIKKNGVNVEVANENQVVGFIHLSPLLLTLNKIQGTLPIYSIQNQCLGTVSVSSPTNEIKKINQLETLKKFYKQSFDRQQKQSQKLVVQRKELIFLSLEKVLLLNSLNYDNQSSFLNDTSSKAEFFDFTKIQAQNRVQILIRINKITKRFSDIVLHYNIDQQGLRVVQLRRKQGFCLNYFQEKQAQNNIVEIQIFNEYKLIAYSKIEITNQQHFIHKFSVGDTACDFFHSEIYIKAIRCETKEGYFREQKMDAVFNIVQNILKNKIMIQALDDNQIKGILNHHKITYIQLKKLFTIFQKSFNQLKSFQKSQLKCIISKEDPQTYESFISISKKLMEQFTYIDSSCNKMIDESQFKKIIKFYRNDIEYSLQKHTDEFLENRVKSKGRIHYIYFVSGFYFIQDKQSLIALPQKENQQANKPKQQKIKVQQVIQYIKQTSIKVQPHYFISKITIYNAHLINEGKAPNICLSISKKVQYSNSNPQFIIEKQVSLLQAIKIYTKNIVENKLILLSQFKPSRRVSLYQLQPSGKCYAKIIWGF